MESQALQTTARTSIELLEFLQSQGRVRMKSYRLGRLAGGMLVILLGTFSLSMAATNGYHLLKKYSFGAAEGSTREYFDYITVDSAARRSEEHTSELQSQSNLVCRLLLEKKKT